MIVRPDGEGGQSGVDLMRRVDLVERSVTDHARIITEFTTHQLTFGVRLDGIEKAYQDDRVEKAGRAERDKQRDADITSIKSGVSRITWLVVTGFVGAVVLWIVKGGLV